MLADQDLCAARKERAWPDQHRKSVDRVSNLVRHPSKAPYRTNQALNLLSVMAFHDWWDPTEDVTLGYSLGTGEVRTPDKWCDNITFMISVASLICIFHPESEIVILG